MKTQIQEKINKVVKVKARELADKENRGFIEAEWLQSQIIQIKDKDLENYINFAQEKGYTSEDIEVNPYISTHSEWYTWLAYSLIHPILGQINSDRIYFPKRTVHHKNFIGPLYQKELSMQNEKKMMELESQLVKARSDIQDLLKENEELKNQIESELPALGRAKE